MRIDGDSLRATHGCAAVGQYLVKSVEPGNKLCLVLCNFCALLVLWGGLAGWHMTAHAHGVNAGDLALDHPYAVPSAAGATHGKAYLRGIRNTGAHPDRLLSASTPVADKVTLHRLLPHATGLREESVQTIDLPARSITRLRHTGDYQLTLLGLKTPLKDGDTFKLTLRFQQVGHQSVTVWVQTPRQPMTHTNSHHAIIPALQTGD